MIIGENLNLRLITISLLCIFLLGCSNVQSEKAISSALDNSEIFQESVVDVEYIDEMITGIDANLSTYRLVKKSLEAEPSEGGEISYYYDGTGDTLAKVEGNFYGSDRQAHNSYYISDAQLINIRETINYYDLDELVNNTDYIIATSETYNYYFEDEKLINVLDEQGNIVFEEDYKSIQKGKLDEFSYILDEI